MLLLQSISFSVCVAVVAVSMADAKSSQGLACGSFAVQEQCIATPGCDWCGKNVTNATGWWGQFAFCYDPSETPGKCCAAAMAGNPGDSSFVCMPYAKLCTGDTHCSRSTFPTSYGPCPEARCCPPDRPQVCHDQCMPAGAHCCGFGYNNAANYCNASTTCCNGGGSFFACCPDGDQCCIGSSTDAWCCPRGEGCGCNMRKKKRGLH